MSNIHEYTYPFKTRDQLSNTHKYKSAWLRAGQMDDVIGQSNGSLKPDTRC